MIFSRIYTPNYDYIYFNCLKFEKEDFIKLKEEIKTIYKYYPDIGLKNVFFILDSKIADLKIEGFDNDLNYDALKYIIKNLYDNEIIKKENLKIETNKGIKTINLKINYNKVTSIIIDIEKPNLSRRSIPVMTDKNVFINEKIKIDNEKYIVSSVNVEGTHTILFCDDIDMIDIKKIGTLISNYRQFPQKTNVEFVSIIDANNIMIRIWKYSKGEVKTCDSSICASVEVGILRKLLNKDKMVNVYTKGGVIRVVCNNDKYKTITYPEICYEEKKYYKI